MSSSRVLLVDDNDDFLDALKICLAGDARLETVGKAHSGLEALDQVTRLQPDLVLMDAATPDLNGFDVTRKIKSLPNAPLVILTTFYESSAVRLEAWAAGANGIVNKAEIGKELLPLVQGLSWPRQEDAAAWPVSRDAKVMEKKDSPR